MKPKQASIHRPIQNKCVLLALLTVILSVAAIYWVVFFYQAEYNLVEVAFIFGITVLVLLVIIAGFVNTTVVTEKGILSNKRIFGKRIFFSWTEIKKVVYVRKGKNISLENVRDASFWNPVTIYLFKEEFDFGNVYWACKQHEYLSFNYRKELVEKILLQINNNQPKN